MKLEDSGSSIRVDIDSYIACALTILEIEYCSCVSHCSRDAADFWSPNKNFRVLMYCMKCVEWERSEQLYTFLQSP